MANPTTNFNWQMPTSTDLVTDLPADFETFGQAVDTSLAELKGGTTGQVLSKTSNTDMDFTWVTTDDANAIQNSIVDAKGDIVAASANDTPARLAVGTDYAFLTADSAQATGLAWDNSAWISYSPTLSAVTGSFTTASASGYYKRVGKICVVKMTGTITTVGTGLGVKISLPFTSKSGQGSSLGVVRESSVTGATGVILVANNSSTGELLRYDNGGWTASGYSYVISCTYEVA
jgi:hypothetical protein